MASYSLWIRHNYDIRRFVVFDGYPVAEFEKLLQAAFGETAAVAGCLVRGGAQASLSSLCSNPSFKVLRRCSRTSPLSLGSLHRVVVHVGIL